jgi:hypothetical protein
MPSEMNGRPSPRPESGTGSTGRTSEPGHRDGRWRGDTSKARAPNAPDGRAVATADRRARSEQGARDARRGPGTQGRAPSDKPDVFLHVPDLHVGEIYLDVEELDAHLSLQARLANLVELVAGVHVHIGKVELDIKDVGAQALLKVRLENLYAILDRALTTVDRNPEVLQGLLDTVGTAVEGVGETAQQAVRPGGAVSSLADNVGEVGKEALGPGGAAAEAVGTVGGAAQQAVRPGGAVTEAAHGLTDTAAQAVQPGGAVSEATEVTGRAAADVSDNAVDVAGGVGRAVGDTAQEVGQGTRDAVDVGGRAANAGHVRRPVRSETDQPAGPRRNTAARRSRPATSAGRRRQSESGCDMRSSRGRENSGAARESSGRRRDSSDRRLP